MSDDRPHELPGSACEIDAERLQHISDHLSRIAGRLAKLSAESASLDMKPDQEYRELLSDIVQTVIRARRLRDSHFPGGLFADPVWDILLELFHARLCSRKVSISDISVATDVPPTTVLRWLNTMTEKGLCTRGADPLDARRSFVELTQVASRALWHYFEQVGLAASIS